jgi:(1->4)-alpha-D-glucan 1-alpha-D-glucosylmutase
VTTIHMGAEYRSLFADFLADLTRHRRLPVATYRWQFHAAFTFVHARQLVPYLHALGIGACYASPYLKARPGSSHGYDVIDFQVLNPEFGTAADYEAFVQAIQQYGMGQLVDIVPNHMGVLACDNAWWQDVLEHGPASHYGRFFAIDWQPPKTGLRNKVSLPVLGAAYGTVLENQELRLAFEAGRFTVHYYEHRFPIAPCTMTFILQPCVESLQQQLGEEHQQVLELQSIITALNHLPPLTEQDPEKIAQRYREATLVQQRLALLDQTCAAFRQTLSLVLQRLNGSKGHPDSFDQLHMLLELQPYRLGFWRVASDEINYRRFFNINDLAALCQEDPVVFDATHHLILDLVATDKATGLRIDHPDGLYDPVGYFQRLQQAYLQRRWQQFLGARQIEAAGHFPVEEALAAHPRPLYVVVEKILEAHETLPETWPIYGTTGYEFLNQLNGVFIDQANSDALRELYADFVGKREAFADVLYTTKKLIMETSMVSELVALGVELDRLSETNRYWRDFTRHQLTAALREVIACFPVYRTYIRSAEEGVNDTDVALINTAVGQARHRNQAMNPTVFDFLYECLVLQYPKTSTAAQRQAQLRFVQKFQQVTGPVMAKGLEDTAFYRYTPLASLNEVGGNPDQFGISVQMFHQHNMGRRQHWPYTLLSTSTHDTKRSEDVRARLNVLSEMPQQWRDSLWRWHRLNLAHKSEVDGQAVPSPQEEYLLYQTLLGAYPLEPQARLEFGARVQAYMRKALREAKVHTSWINPNLAYEEAIDRFIAALLDEQRSAPFLEDFDTMQRTIAQYGMWNSLSQTLLKLTSPGVPDIYQGCELWDLSLVDPDNRRPVDYAQRQQWLSDLQQRCAGPQAERLSLLQELIHSRQDGRLKLYVVWQALTFRRTQAAVFLAGDYLPLLATGSKQSHLCAFARVHGERAVLLVLAPRFFTRLLSREEELPLGPAVWGDTQVVLPAPLAGREYRQIFTGEIVEAKQVGNQTVLPLAAACATFPMALLERLN